MGLRQIISRVIDQVQRVTPTTGSDETFVCQDDGDGGTVRLEDLAEGGAIRTRVFEVRQQSLPSDDGEAFGARLRCTLLVRVYYHQGTFGSRTFMERAMGEDVAAIVGRLRLPSNWDRATNGTDAWVFEGSNPTVEPFADESSFIVSIPFDVIYRE